MFIIDSNILISEILTQYEKDEKTSLYRKMFRQIPLIKRVIPDFILNEFELYMIQVVPSRYKNKMSELEKTEVKSTTSDFMQYLLKECALASVSSAEIKNAFVIYKKFQNTHYISFTDSLLLASANSNGYTIFSKDERLNARADELNITYYKPD